MSDEQKGPPARMNVEDRSADAWQKTRIKSALVQRSLLGSRNPIPKFGGLKSLSDWNRHWSDLPISQKIKFLEGQDGENLKKELYKYGDIRGKLRMRDAKNLGAKDVKKAASLEQVYRPWFQGALAKYTDSIDAVKKIGSARTGRDFLRGDSTAGTRTRAATHSLQSVDLGADGKLLFQDIGRNDWKVPMVRAKSAIDNREALRTLISAVSLVGGRNPDVVKILSRHLIRMQRALENAERRSNAHARIQFHYLLQANEDALNDCVKGLRNPDDEKELRLTVSRAERGMEGKMKEFTKAIQEQNRADADAIRTALSKDLQNIAKEYVFGFDENRKDAHNAFIGSLPPATRSKIGMSVPTIQDIRDSIKFVSGENFSRGNDPLTDRAKQFDDPYTFRKRQLSAGPQAGTTRSKSKPGGGQGGDQGGEPPKRGKV